MSRGNALYKSYRIVRGGPRLGPRKSLTFPPRLIRMVHSLPRSIQQCWRIRCLYYVIRNLSLVFESLERGRFILVGHFRGCMSISERSIFCPVPLVVTPDCMHTPTYHTTWVHVVVQLTATSTVIIARIADYTPCTSHWAPDCHSKFGGARSVWLLGGNTWSLGE